MEEKAARRSLLCPTHGPEIDDKNDLDLDEYVRSRCFTLAIVP